MFVASRGRIFRVWWLDMKPLNPANNQSLIDQLTDRVTCRQQTSRTKQSISPRTLGFISQICNNLARPAPTWPIAWHPLRGRRHLLWHKYKPLSLQIDQHILDIPNHLITSDNTAVQSSTLDTGNIFHNKWLLPSHPSLSCHTSHFLDKIFSDIFPNIPIMNSFHQSYKVIYAFYTEWNISTFISSHWTGQFNRPMTQNMIYMI